MNKEKRKNIDEANAHSRLKIIELQDRIECIEQEIKMNENLKQYPCVKAAPHGDHNQIILFTEPLKGMNINGIGHRHGYISDHWGEDGFKPYTGAINYVDGKSVEGKDIYE